MHELVLEEFQKSGLSQAALARRLNTRPELISRRLGAPGNWRLDTVSDLLFAISGGEPVKEVGYPLAATPANRQFADWLSDTGVMRYWDELERRAGVSNDLNQSGPRAFFTLSKPQDERLQK